MKTYDQLWHGPNANMEKVSSHFRMSVGEDGQTQIYAYIQRYRKMYWIS